MGPQQACGGGIVSKGDQGARANGPLPRGAPYFLSLRSGLRDAPRIWSGAVLSCKMVRLLSGFGESGVGLRSATVKLRAESKVPR